MGGYHTKIQSMIFSSMSSREDPTKKMTFARQTFPELRLGGPLSGNVDGFSVKGKRKQSHRFHVTKTSLADFPMGQKAAEEGDSKENALKKDELMIVLRNSSRSAGTASGGRRRRRGAAREAVRLTAGRHRWQVERLSEEDAAALQSFLRQGLVSCLMTVAHLRSLHCPQVKGWSSCPDIKNLPDSTEPLPSQGEDAAGTSISVEIPGKRAFPLASPKVQTRLFVVRRVPEEEIMGNTCGAMDDVAECNASPAASAVSAKPGEDSASSGNEKKLHVHWKDLEG